MKAFGMAMAFPGAGKSALEDPQQGQGRCKPQDELGDDEQC